MERIPYTKPSITQLEIDYVNDAVSNGWGSHCYDYLNKFEANFCRYIGTRYAIATASCTGALSIGLAAMGIKKGDEVILADTNWIATLSPIVHLGAKPIFVDICPKSWCIEPTQIEAKITKKTKAIIATHLYGNLCYMKEIIAIGSRHGIKVIEDSAEAIGSVYHGTRAGALGHFGVFSFHGTKTMTTGEGGIFVTNNEELYNTALTLSNHGRDKKQTKQFWADMVGYKFKMSNMQAAMGCAQLERIDELIKRKQNILKRYKDLLEPISGVTLNFEMENTINGAWMPTVVFDTEIGLTQERLLLAFHTNNIDARVFFWPLSSLPMFDAKKTNVNAYDIPNRAINLPSYHDITNQEINKVSDTIKEFFN